MRPSFDKKKNALSVFLAAPTYPQPDVSVNIILVVFLESYALNAYGVLTSGLDIPAATYSCRSALSVRMPIKKVITVTVSLSSPASRQSSCAAQCCLNLNRRTWNHCAGSGL